MITVTPGATFSADAMFGSTYTGLAGTVGVLLQDSTGAIVQARTTVGISEHPAGSGLYVKSFVAPVVGGQFSLVWDTGGGSPVYAAEDVVVSSSYVPSIGTPPALVSVGAAQQWLRRQNVTGQSLTDDLNLLQIIIQGISRAIGRHTEREFVDPTGNNSDLARTFEYDGSGFLDFAPYDLRSITSLTLGGQAMVATTGFGDGDYVSMPRNGTLDGTYTYLTMRGYYRLGASHFIFAPITRTRDVVITGKWGMTAVPADVQLACLIAVADLYRNPEQGSSRGSGDFQVVEVAENPGTAESLPIGARKLLEPFIRPKVA